LSDRSRTCYARRVLTPQNRALLDAFRAGERSALESVYRHYVGAVVAVLRGGVALSGGGRVPGAPADVVSDLVQETFIRAFSERARLAYDGLRDYQPYLLTIARNLLIDWARTQGRTLELPEDLGELPAETPLASARHLGVAEAYIASLSGELRQAHEQRYVLGRTQEEAARALGVSRHHVRTLERHLQQGLRRAIARSEKSHVEKRSAQIEPAS
jgi:RNA polymerase sigma-70 factor (ECF subfamily)